MRSFLIYVLFSSFIYANECENLYAQVKESSIQVDALVKSEVASRKAYELINTYLDLASLTVATCATSESSIAFRITRELNADMKRMAPLREQFRVQSFNELKQEALIQAKKEAECTNVYNNTYMQRKQDGPSIQPIHH